MRFENLSVPLEDPVDPSLEVPELSASVCGTYSRGMQMIVISDAWNGQAELEARTE